MQARTHRITILRMAAWAAALALIPVGVALLPAPATPAAEAAEPDPQRDLAAAMLALHPLAAAAAGASTDAYDALLAGLAETEELEAFTAAEVALRKREAEFAALRERVWRRGGSPEELETLAALRRSAAHHTAARDKALEALRAAAMERLAQTVGAEDAALA